MGFLLVMNASKRHKKNPFPEESFWDETGNILYWKM